MRLKGDRTAKYYTLRWWTPSGRRCSQSLGRSTTWAEAKEFKRAKETALASGAELVDRPERMTLSQLIDYHKQVAGPDLRPRSRQEYADCGKHLLAVLGADKPIDKLTMADSSKVKTYLQDERKVSAGAGSPPIR